MSIQLQPQIAELEKWTILAGQEDAVFEVMDPFMGPVLGALEKQLCIAERYKKPV